MTSGSPGSVLVIGGGQAGAWAAKTLRDEGFTGRVSLVAAEGHLPYERPPLSKGVLLGEPAAEATRLFPESLYRDLDIEVRTSDPVVGLSLDRCEAVTRGGAQLGYDRLILCTGGRARRPELRGIDLPGVHVLRTIEDAVALRDAMKVAKRVAVIGGGWIGLETAAAARALGVEVLLVESGERLCARSVPPFFSEVLRRHHSASGVDIRLSTGLRAIEAHGDGRLRVSLDDATEAIVCAVVVGVGLVPNDDLARDAGLETRHGVVVDEHCRTSDPSVFAAGDVAIGPFFRSGERIRLESWQNAQDQAICAARNALGIAQVYQPLPWFWSDQHGLKIQIVGAVDDRSSCVIRGSLEDAFVAFFTDDGVVVAAIGCNAPRDMRHVRRLVERRRDLAGVDLSDLGLSLASL